MYLGQDVSATGLRKAAFEGRVGDFSSLVSQTGIMKVHMESLQPVSAVFTIFSAFFVRSAGTKKQGLCEMKGR